MEFQEFQVCIVVATLWDSYWDGLSNHQFGVTHFSISYSSPSHHGVSCGQASLDLCRRLVGQETLRTTGVGPSCCAGDDKVALWRTLPGTWHQLMC